MPPADHVQGPLRAPGPRRGGRLHRQHIDVRRQGVQDHVGHPRTGAVAVAEDQVVRVMPPDGLARDAGGLPPEASAWPTSSPLRISPTRPRHRPEPRPGAGPLARHG
ncbi:hypothetical protein SLI_0086 [Streptomyces lividans 1326]|uniref:Uncharacterized protein n=1 Tax=Streptomyces lividans 1326 TaxID=1200984 RepID=A0A7U9DKL3_STRLI|nr:hypothetical protein SLI_0086 [Streptomyces lividans 1326]